MASPLEPVDALVWRQARQHAAKVAVHHAGGKVDYAELVGRAQRTAETLRDAGVRERDFVGLLLARGIDLVVAALAVLRVGAAYVPLDPEWPWARTQAMIDDASMQVLVVDRRQAALPTVATPVHAASSAAPAGVARAGSADAPCCVFTTSGTTGRPKGVVARHRGIVTTVVENPALRFDATTCFLQQAPPMWDMAALETWASLANGGTLVLAGDRHLTAQRLAEATSLGVESVCLAAGLLNALIDEDLACFERLRMLFTGGERASAAHLRRLLRAHPDLLLLHGYGPAEATCTSLVCRLREEDVADDARDVPLGTPIRDRFLHIVAPDSPAGATSVRTVPRGEVGEAYIGGPALAERYLADRAGVDERFAVVSVDGGPPRRMYRSGDLLRELPSGDVVFCGRRDRQLKLRGQRIEPSDCEAALRTLDGIRNAFVSALTAPDDRPRGLVAHYTTVSGAPLDPSALRARLGELLPAYMCPDWFVHVERLPLNGSGKVDARALPAPTVEHRARVAGRQPAPERGAEPASELVGAIADAIAEILGLAQVDWDVELDALGGDSLHATRLASRLFATYGVDVTVSELLVAGSARRVAAIVERGTAQSLPDPEPVVGARTLASDAQASWLLADELAYDAAESRVVSAFALDAPLDRERLGAALEHVVARHDVLHARYELDGVGVMQVSDVAGVERPLRPERDGSLEQLLASAASGVVLAAGRPLCAATSSGSEPALALAIHHIAADGWSEAVILQELADAYRGRRAGTASSSYATYAAWQRRLLELVSPAQTTFWIEQLRGVRTLPFSEDPSLAAEPVVQRPLSLPAATVAALDAVAKAHGSTRAALLLTAYIVALQRVSGERDIAVGTLVTGRRHPAFDRTVGCFINALALRPRVDPDDSPAERVGRVSACLDAALANQDLPFNRVVAAVNPSRRASHPIFQAAFVLQPPTLDVLDFGDARGRRIELEAVNGTVFHPLLRLWPGRGAPGVLDGQLLHRFTRRDTHVPGAVADAFLAAVEALAAG